MVKYKAKPYLGLQNLGCHFDTQKRLKKTLLKLLGLLQKLKSNLLGLNKDFSMSLILL